MNSTELNNEFTILFEDLATSGSKGLNSYERSICFTNAQELLTRQFAQKGILDPIDSLITLNEEITQLASIYETATDFAKVSNPFHVLGYFIKSNDINQGDIGLTATDEAFINRSLLVNPYKYPPRNVAYVVMGETKLTVFPPFSYNLKSVVTTYVSKPTPIILETLTGGDTIDSLTAVTAPVIKESYHRDLINAAVQFAITVYIGQPEKEVSNDNSRNK